MYRSSVLSCVLIFQGVALGQQAEVTRPAITGLSHMTLYADDLRKSQKFYGDLLGWEQIPAGKVESEVRFYANHLQYIEPCRLFPRQANQRRHQDTDRRDGTRP